MSDHPAHARRRLLSATLLLALAGLNPCAWAQETVHKCVGAQGKVTYQDAPCDKNLSIRNPPAAVSTVPGGAEAGATSPVMLQLDAAVKSALSGNDLARAKRLAVTAQHWDWIARAEKENPALATAGRTPGDPQAHTSSSNDCRQARRSYELESDSPEAIEKKRQLMYAACGMQAPPASEAPAGQTVIVTPMHRHLHHPPPRSGPSVTRPPRPPRTPEYPEGVPARPNQPGKDR